MKVETVSLPPSLPPLQAAEIEEVAYVKKSIVTKEPAHRTHRGGISKLFMF